MGPDFDSLSISTRLKLSSQRFNFKLYSWAPGAAINRIIGG
ncbi:hypothetical protein SAMN05421647_105319 [Marinobacterium stanieri]|uniref:Uncharacterized protein n=1 Tax=Marinobacterium stanieri TaxID=49186 RepID=A0A1N6TG40_9GAMM|nr:hypothetical protein SAMN05421647_105319 [Marinobacterium stanieri]